MNFGRFCCRRCSARAERGLHHGRDVGSQAAEASQCLHVALAFGSCRRGCVRGLGFLTQRWHAWRLRAQPRFSGFSCNHRRVMFRCFVLACAAGAVAAAAPQVINAEFDAAEAGATLPGWDGRARSLAQRVGAVEKQLSAFLGPQRAASLLALQPVDADRVRDGLAVTEAMPAADGLSVNVVEREA